MTNRQRTEMMARARAKQRRKKALPEAKPAGVLGQVAQLAASAAQSVGAAVKSATAALAGA